MVCQVNGLRMYVEICIILLDGFKCYVVNKVHEGNFAVLPGGQFPAAVPLSAPRRLFEADHNISRRLFCEDPRLTRPRRDRRLHAVRAI